MFTTVLKANFIVLILVFFSHSLAAQEWKQLIDSADSYYDNKPDSAITLYLKAKNILPRDSTERYLWIISSMGDCYFKTAKYRTAAEMYIEMKNIIYDLQGKSADYVTACSNLGSTYENIGNFAEAEKFFLEGLEVQQKNSGKDDTEGDYSLFCDHLSSLYQVMGDQKLAEKYILEAIDIRKKKKDTEPIPYSYSLDNIASLYYAMGDYTGAENYIKEALQYREAAGKDSYWYNASLFLLGRFYHDEGRNEKALEIYLKIFALSSNKWANDDSPLYPEVTIALGNYYLGLKNFTEAEKYLLLYNELCENGNDKRHHELGESLYFLGYLNYAQGQYDKAENYYLSALPLIKKTFGEYNTRYFDICKNTGILYWVKQQDSLATAYFDLSSRLRKNATEKILEFTSEQQKSIYFENVLTDDDEYFSFYYSKNLADKLYDLSLFQRNLTLSYTQELKNTILNRKDPVLKSKFNKWIESRNNLSIALTKKAGDDSTTIKSLVDESNALEKELINLSGAFSEMQKKRITGYPGIRRSLKQDEASIEFISFHYFDGKRYTDSTYYIALLAEKNYPLPRIIKLFEKKQLDSLLTYAENRSGNEGTANLYASRGIKIINKNKSIYSYPVYDLVWKPLESQLKGIKKIYIAPTGMLHRIAFSALPVNKKQVLSDKYLLVQVTSTNTVPYQQETYFTNKDNFILYGGIDYDADPTQLEKVSLSNKKFKNQDVSLTFLKNRGNSESFNFLPGTYSEIRSIEKNALNSKKRVLVLSGPNATEESFKTLNGPSSPALLHLATHGFFFPDPKINGSTDLSQLVDSVDGKIFKQSLNPLFRSGLLFAGANNSWHGRSIKDQEDGILTSYEVSNMYMPNTKLAVLSACETALGDIKGSEGVYGLQRAFKIAGVKNLVMSLWKVPDYETAEFMRVFYRNLFNKRSVSEAFYQTQATMKNKYRQNPYKWAAWNSKIAN